jgi:hypothetical protein
LITEWSRDINEDWNIRNLWSSSWQVTEWYIIVKFLGNKKSKYSKAYSVKFSVFEDPKKL